MADLKTLILGIAAMLDQLYRATKQTAAAYMMNTKLRPPLMLFWVQPCKLAGKRRDHVLSLASFAKLVPEATLVVPSSKRTVGPSPSTRRE
jgi:hypothetical protein